MLTRLLLSLLLTCLLITPAWAAVEFNDTFTDTNGVDLTAHTPDTGVGWVAEVSTGPSTGEIQANAATSTTASGDHAWWTSMNISGGASSAEYDVICTMATLHRADSSRPMYLIGRATATNTYYAAKINDDAPTNEFRLFKVSAGTWTELAVTTTLPADGSVIKLEIRDAAKKVYDDGIEILSSTDNALTAAGSGGIGMGDLHENDAGTSAVNKWDNCSLETVTAAPARRPIAPIIFSRLADLASLALTFMEPSYALAH